MPIHYGSKKKDVNHSAVKNKKKDEKDKKKKKVKQPKVNKKSIKNEPVPKIKGMKDMMPSSRVKSKQ